MPAPFPRHRASEVKTVLNVVEARISGANDAEDWRTIARQLRHAAHLAEGHSQYLKSQRDTTCPD